jgi:DNA-binding MarR family transcriptional regulator
MIAAPAAQCHLITMKTKEKSRKLAAEHSKESLRTWLRMLSCETVIEQHLRTLLRQNFSVTLPQFDVLSELERAGEPLTMSQLSKELMVSNGNVTGVIDRLEKTGFARRVRAKHDRRIQYIELTTKGRTEFTKMATRHERWLAELLSDLSLTEMGKLQELLLKARQSVGSG